MEKFTKWAIILTVSLFPGIALIMLCDGALFMFGGVLTLIAGFSLGELQTIHIITTKEVNHDE